VLLQACLNGGFTREHHPAMPVSATELAAEAVACERAGAGSLHFHPRDENGRETLAPEVIGRVVEEVKNACTLPICLSTGDWIEPDPTRRAALVGEWRGPDLATVNLIEKGASEVMEALLSAGIGIEAGLWEAADVDRLIATGLTDRVQRVLVETDGRSRVEALRTISDIHAALDANGLSVERLQHGDGEAAWAVLEDSVRRGVGTRIGFEDTVSDPDGNVVASNADLVRIARSFGAGN
jgi:uncharacterized protein (DUF849 family)